MFDGDHLNRSHLKLQEFEQLHPVQRRQVVRGLALEEVRESAAHAGLPLTNLDRVSWEEAIDLANTLRPEPTSTPEAAMREADVPLVADSEVPPDTGQDRQNREETLSFLREAGIPTTQRAPADTADESADRPLIEHLQEAGVPMKGAGLSDQEAALSRRLDQLERMVETGTRPAPAADPLAAAFEHHQEEQPECTWAEAMREAGLPMKAAS
jgi:hypothetical protein